MSYSGSGAIVLKNWKRDTTCEDVSFAGSPKPASQPWFDRTGLKLDVLMEYYKKFGHDQNALADWLLIHPHHAIIGERNGLSIIMHKNEPSFLWKGKEFKIKLKRGIPTERQKGGYTFTVSHVDVASTRDVLFAMVLCPGGDVYVAVSGYGVGDGDIGFHKKGRTIRRKGQWHDMVWDVSHSDAIESNEVVGTIPGYYYPTPREWEQLLRWQRKCLEHQAISTL